jgi:hypothetical protein
MEMETSIWIHGHGDMDMDTWKFVHGHGDIDVEKRTWRYGNGDMETWTRRNGHEDMKLKYQTENGKQTPCHFLNPFIVCSLCKRKFVVCPYVNEETNGSYPFANGLNGLAHL